MNKLPGFVLSGVLWLLPAFAQACDVCGCTSSGSQTGILALSRAHLAGVRWQAQSFVSRPHGSGTGANDHFQSCEAWGRVSLHPRLQLSGALPYQMNGRDLTDGRQQRVQGIGDARLQLQFALLSPKRQAMRRWQHTAWIGGGLKLPTGRYTGTDTEGQAIHINMQTGTGSTDALVSAVYAINRDNIGCIAEGAFRYTHANPLGFQFGRRLVTSAALFWSKQFRQVTCIPQAGIMRDHAMRDYDGNRSLSESGGTLWAGNLALDIRIKKILIHTNYRVPLAHNLAQGYVSPQSNIQAGITYLFGKTKPPVSPLPADVQPPGKFKDIQPIQTH